jgi:hypothetical protein
VLFGVAETKEMLEIATRMISVLLLDWKGQIDNDRIESADSAKPRPLRIKLDNYQQKRKALSSKRKLATFPEIKGTSVQLEMTKTEQEMSKERSNTKTIKPGIEIKIYSTADFERCNATWIVQIRSRDKS